MRHIPAWSLCLAGLAAATLGGFWAVEAAVSPALLNTLERSAVIAVAVGEFLDAIPLVDGVGVEQELRPERPNLTGVRIRTAAWRKRPSAYSCRWQLETQSADGHPRSIVREGRLDAHLARDWGFIDIVFTPIADSAGQTFVLVFSAEDQNPAHPLGLPVHTTSGTGAPLRATFRDPAPPIAVPRHGASLHAYLLYDK